MNIMFKIKDKVVTPALLGTVLPGITRKSVIEMLKSWNIEVEERLVTLEEILTGIKNGDVEEAWCCGTAAVISPVGLMEYHGKVMEISCGKIGPVAQSIYDTLVGIQRGDRSDPYGWIMKLS